MRYICRVCSSGVEKIFSAELLHCSVQYFECSHCGYVQTETPYWLDEAYSSAINAFDTGILWRNRVNAQVVLMTLLALGVAKERVVDFAGGYGLLVRQLRDLGVDALWRDKYCTNLIARGFEHNDEPAVLVTAFEVFEHLVDPVETLEHLLTIAPNVLLSTEVMSTPAPGHGDWWYYGREHGQHIGFFRLRTLQRLADRFGCRLITDGQTYHLFSRARIPDLLWQMGLRVRQLAPLLAFFLLKSKKMPDHDALVSNYRPK